MYGDTLRKTYTPEQLDEAVALVRDRLSKGHGIVMNCDFELQAGIFVTEGFGRDGRGSLRFHYVNPLHSHDITRWYPGDEDQLPPTDELDAAIQHSSPLAIRNCAMDYARAARAPLIRLIRRLRGQE